MNIKILSVIAMFILQNTCIAMQQINVKSITDLSCYYNYKVKAENKSLLLKVEDCIYYKMSYMCTAIKILNGLLLVKGNISETDIKGSSYTPNSPNVLVSYVCVIKKIKDGSLEYIPIKNLFDVYVSCSCNKEFAVEPELLEEIYNVFLSDSTMSLGKIGGIFNNPKKSSQLGHTEEKLLKNLSALDIKEVLGVTVDMFSWLDVCSSCTDKIIDFKFQNETPIIFRAISQRKYDDCKKDSKLFPLDLSNEPEPSFNFQSIHEQHLFVATRIEPSVDRIRDLVIENLQTKIVSFALNKDIAFWKETYSFNFIEKTSQYENVLSIFELKFPIDGLLLKANNILRSNSLDYKRSNSLDYKEKIIDSAILEELYGKLQLSLINISLHPKCELFLTLFAKQTGYPKSGTTCNWIKVFCGNAILRLAQQENNEDSKNKYIEQYRNNYRLYDNSSELYKVVSWFNYPENIEHYNIQMLQNMEDSESQVE